MTTIQVLVVILLFIGKSNYSVAKSLQFFTYSLIQVVWKITTWPLPLSHVPVQEMNLFLSALLKEMGEPTGEEQL